MSASWRETAAVIRTAAETERKWMNAVLQDDAERRSRFLPWMPFPLTAFIEMLAEALPEIAGGRFLEIGAGPGTKMLVAREIFGLDVHGIEYCDDYAAAARTTGLDVVTADALEWPGYGNYELIWFNRAFRDPAPEAELEDLVWRTADAGTVVMCANLEDRPPAAWYPVLDAWQELRRGIWQKPFGSVRS